jgi:hypothetical protein
MGMSKIAIPREKEQKEQDRMGWETVFKGTGLVF